MPDDFITPSAAARQASVSATTVRQWIKRYPGLGYRVGGRWRVDPPTFQRVLSGDIPPASR